MHVRVLLAKIKHEIETNLEGIDGHTMKNVDKHLPGGFNVCSRLNLLSARFDTRIKRLSCIKK